MSFLEKTMDLQCSICLRRFQEPIILDCGHTFDRLCIQNMIDSNKSFVPTKVSRCPLCNHTINIEQPLILNKTLTNLIKCESTYEWFLIDITSEQEKINVLKFLQYVFDKRDIFQTNHITFETTSTRMTFNGLINFDKQLEIKSFINLGNILEEIYIDLQTQNGLRKICILTDGLTKHSNLPKIDSNLIHQRFLIHLGDKNISRTRELADKINFQFGYFNEKILDIYVQHFLTNF